MSSAAAPVREIVIQEQEYTICKYHGLPEKVVSFFEAMSWGSAGTVYVRKNASELVRQLKDPWLFSIEQQDEILATAIFCHTHPYVIDQVYNCYIIRYFAAGKSIQGKKLVKHYAGKVMEAVRQEEPEKTIYIGCVEKGNIRSFKVVQNAGYEILGVQSVNAFSRFFPQPQPDIEQVTTIAQQQEVVTLLKHHYRQHVLVHFDYLFLNNHYYVIREQGEIVAGCQYHRAHWSVNQMPGVMGWIIMNMLPKMPLISKLYNPKRFEFLALEGIYYKAGYEHTLHRLFEGLLNLEKVYSSLLWMGETCPYRDALVSYGKLGLLNHFVKDSGVYIMTFYQNMTEAEINQLKSGPLYASSFDYI
jgi:hypothetical protein